MQAASRESLANAVDRLDQVGAGADAEALRSLADELFAVLGVLERERVLRRHLTDPGTPEDARERLAARLSTRPSVAAPTLPVSTRPASALRASPGALGSARCRRSTRSV